jgi:hypothetical protein
MARIHERIPRDPATGHPLYRTPHCEAVGELGEVFDGPADSTDVVDFDENSSPAFLLGKLETLQTVYKDVAPSACKGHIRKGIQILQSLVGPRTESAKLEHKAGVVEQLSESATHGHLNELRTRDDDYDENEVRRSFGLLAKVSDDDLRKFVNRLR